MFWQEDDTESAFEVSDDIVDVLFSIECKWLPVDHAFALSAALREALPWMAQGDSGIAVHAVHVAGSQNGWERPEHGSDQHLIVSKRTKLAIRVTKERMDQLMDDLKNRTLDVSGCPLRVREGKIRPLSKETTLFSRFVASASADTEENFLEWAVQELRTLDVRVRKALCGKTTPLTKPEGILNTRSLLLADLSPKESVRLQQIGLGPHREMCCGIFIPHKGINAVQKTA